MKTVIFAAMAAAAFATPAFAQDAAPFTGARAEVLAGYDKLDTNGSGLGNPDGFLYGIALGYDAQMGGAVLGIEGEISDSTANTEAFGTDVDAARDLYIGARAGFLVGPQALAYVKAGYTNARIEYQGCCAENGDGVRVGAGLEYKLNGQMFVKGEYRYSNYEADVERHQVVAGLGIRF
ncbi:outer membrane immunogenic protein [Sphingobium sp. OAS761]|uniref:outer membrane protein n=1 Tax=Sphingobium sp. OAS761 TaxID=2817901 RepID=UPI00209EC14E|nr:porin family protein [Sphingobium sp. OAS761]MCP1468998.1 outer membrane immunogenic protein [Sphingobium sp. OAS761]